MGRLYPSSDGPYALARRGRGCPSRPEENWRLSDQMVGAAMFCSTSCCIPRSVLSEEPTWKSIKCDQLGERLQLSNTSFAGSGTADHIFTARGAYDPLGSPLNRS